MKKWMVILVWGMVFLLILGVSLWKPVENVLRGVRAVFLFGAPREISQEGAQSAVADLRRDLGIETEFVYEAISGLDGGGRDMDIYIGLFGCSEETIEALSSAVAGLPSRLTPAGSASGFVGEATEPNMMTADEETESMLMNYPRNLPEWWKPNDLPNAQFYEIVKEHNRHIWRGYDLIYSEDDKTIYFLEWDT